MSSYWYFQYSHKYQDCYLQWCWIKVTCGYETKIHYNNFSSYLFLKTRVDIYLCIFTLIGWLRSVADWVEVLAGIRQELYHYSYSPGRILLEDMNLPSWKSFTRSRRQFVPYVGWSFFARMPHECFSYSANKGRQSFLQERLFDSHCTHCYDIFILAKIDKVLFLKTKGTIKQIKMGRDVPGSCEISRMFSVPLCKLGS